MTTAAEKVTTDKVATEIDKNLPEKRKALGRGLESLLPSGPRVVMGSGPAATATAGPATPVASTHSTVIRLGYIAIDSVELP